MNFNNQKELNQNQENSPVYTRHQLGSLSQNEYKKMYEQSIENPESFWSQQAQLIDWISPFTKVKDVSFHQGNVSISWFKDAKLNVSYNCIDRHLPEKKDQTAFIFESDDPDVSYHVTYGTLYEKVNRFANVLKKIGIKKGDCVVIYMPMIIDSIVAMLACARIGAIHSVVFAGFSAQALRQRILNCGAKLVITVDQSIRGGKKTPLKEKVDEALGQDYAPCVSHVLVVENVNRSVNMHSGRDVWYDHMAAQVDEFCEPEVMDAEDPLFILYTSGSTGEPKGVVHTCGGYLVFAHMSYFYVFDYKLDDIFWCTADIGWITGHSYIVYGPLSNGSTSILFEGIPTYPDAGRYWQICQKHQVTKFYTAPTVLRSLMGKGDHFVDQYDLSSLRLLGTVGEMINPESWVWFYEKIGRSSCPIVDTWWQTETGGIMMLPLPGVKGLKPGAVMNPFFGIRPLLLDSQGNEIKGNMVTGNLVLTDSWPGQMRTIYQDHDRFMKTYFCDEFYITGDGAFRDQDGHYWITGRTDDVINVSGHRMGTAELENAVSSHLYVAEVAVVGMPHEIKGEGLYAYVVLKNNSCEDEEEFKKEIIQHVRQSIGPIATFDCVQIVPALPKTRSGKVMRRILRQIATGNVGDLGDISTLADESVLEKLIEGR